MPQYRLLDTFRATFEGKVYKHRNSTLGDFIALHLFEDLYELQRSAVLRRRMERGERVVNTANTRRGVRARRGDGSFGEIIPGTETVSDPNFVVPRGRIATIEIGAEVKIFAKAMIKQIGRVESDMRDQVQHFRRGGGAAHPVCVGLVGVNHADQYTSYEGAAVWRTTGTASYLHPSQEAAEVIRRITRDVRPLFDELVFLSYRASNVEPYPFGWVDYENTQLDYGAMLVRVSREYEHRFDGHAPPSLASVPRADPIAAEPAADFDPSQRPPRKPRVT